MLDHQDLLELLELRAMLVHLVCLAIMAELDQLANLALLALLEKRVIQAIPEHLEYLANQAPTAKREPLATMVHLA